ncbi:MAG: N-formylglutamate amidohydrolase [Planctomycetaceae bacterium]
MNARTNDRPLKIVVSCEHAGNQIPAAYRKLFRGAEEVLASHRGYDLGSHEIGKHFSRAFGAPLVVTKTSRLLVEVNRSLGHPSLFSEWSSQLGVEERRKLVATYYEPHRANVISRIDDGFRRGVRVVHLSMHTFTPVLHGQKRRADVGLLYDPRRPSESRLCRLWAGAIARLRPDLAVRRNYPYRGVSDGFTTALRKRYSEPDYLGIELELNQKWVSRSTVWRTLIRDVANAFASAREQF